MPKITTTLKAIRDAGPCASGYKKVALTQNQSPGEFAVADILESNGVDDTLWVLAKACGETGKTICHVAACDFAERALPAYESRNPGDNRPRGAIEAKRRWVAGNATDEELESAATHAAAAEASATHAAAAAEAAYDAHAASAEAASAAHAATHAAAAAYDATTSASAYEAASYAAASASAAASFAIGAATSASDASYAERVWQAQHLRELLMGE